MRRADSLATRPITPPRVRQRRAVGCGAATVLNMMGTTGLSIAGVRKCKGTIVPWVELHLVGKVRLYAALVAAIDDFNSEFRITGHLRLLDLEPGLDGAGEMIAPP